MRLVMWDDVPRQKPARSTAKGCYACCRDGELGPGDRIAFGQAGAGPCYG